MNPSIRPALPLTIAEKEVIRLRAQLKAVQPRQQAAAAAAAPLGMDGSTSDLGMIDATMDAHELDRAAKRYQARNLGVDYVSAVRAVLAGG